MRGFVAISRNTSIESMVEMLAVNDTTGNEAVRVQYLPLLWPVRQLGAAIEPNDVILTNLMTSYGRGATATKASLVLCLFETD